MNLKSVNALLSSNSFDYYKKYLIDNDAYKILSEIFDKYYDLIDEGLLDNKGIILKLEEKQKKLLSLLSVIPKELFILRNNINLCIYKNNGEKLIDNDEFNKKYEKVIDNFAKLKYLVIEYEKNEEL